MANLFSSGAPHSHSSPVTQLFCLLSGLPTGTVIVLLQGEFRGQVTKWRYLPIVVCNRNCVILQIKRARCSLNKEILDLLIESGSGVRSGRASL